jgi:hypothetical protein
MFDWECHILGFIHLNVGFFMLEYAGKDHLNEISLDYIRSFIPLLGLYGSSTESL